MKACTHSERRSSLKKCSARRIVLAVSGPPAVREDYSHSNSPEPPSSVRMSFCLGKPSLMRSTVSA
jgi:hypothetical protein